MNDAVITATMKVIDFPQYPDHDCIWDACRGPDGKIYFSICSEGKAAVAQLMVLDPKDDTVRWILDVGDLSGDPMRPGKIPQSKIHTTMCPANDGMLYFATHCTAPPPGEDLFETVGTYGDDDFGYAGSFAMSYNTQTHEAKCLGMLAPFEGLRAMVLDENRRVLYGITYPKHHLHAFDIDKGGHHDLGRIGNLGSFGMFIDARGRVFGTDDAGRLWRFDPDSNRIEELSVRLPGFAWRQSPYNFLWYAVHGPDGRIYGSTYYDGHLFRYDPLVESEGRMEDLGPGWGEDADQGQWAAPYIQAPVFDKEGRLWYGYSPIWEPVHLVCYADGVKTDMGIMEQEGLTSAFLAESAATADGSKIYFGDITMQGRPRLLVMEPQEILKGNNG